MRHTLRNKKMLARERIKLLVDENYPILEIAPFSGLGLEYGNISAAGNITVVGKISGELCIIGASDATVKGRYESLSPCNKLSFFPFKLIISSSTRFYIHKVKIKKILKLQSWSKLLRQIADLQQKIDISNHMESLNFQSGNDETA